MTDDPLSFAMARDDRLAGTAPAPSRLQPGWKNVVLVCKACAKRSKGPKKLAPRDVARQIGRACRDAGLPRTRVVMTTCLSACPKKAYTVAAASATGGVAVVAFRRGDDAAAAVATLFPGAAAIAGAPGD